MKLSLLIKRQSYINLFNLLFHLLFIFKIIESQNSECGRNQPFLVSNICTSKPCSKEGIDSKDCIINNTIIKTQWLNNIKLIGGSGFRYINFANYSNGDMIVCTTSYPVQPERIFFGLTADGRPFFKENGEEKFIYSINITDASYTQYEADYYIIKSSNSENYGKEYFFSISKLGCNAELFDFDNNKAYVKTSKSFSGIEYIVSNRNAFIFLENATEYNYLFGLVVGYAYPTFKIHFQIHKFNSISNFKRTKTLTKEIIVDELAYGNMISCYLSPGGLIYCLHMLKNNSKIYLKLDKYEKDLTGNKHLSLESNLWDNMNFFKCINFKDEISVLAFYGNFSDIFYPILCLGISINDLKNLKITFQEIHTCQVCI